MQTTETFYYDNKIVRAFGIATVVFGIVGMIAGLWAAIQIYYPQIGLGLAPTTFGRLRPAHQRHHFRLCGKRHVCRCLLFPPAFV
ncbi:MAG: hypothetical protein QM664_02295 [Flavihumibacter sp.]